VTTTPANPQSVVAESEIDDGWSLEPEPGPQSVSRKPVLAPLRLIPKGSLPAIPGLEDGFALPPVGELAQGTEPEADSPVVAEAERDLVFKAGRVLATKANAERAMLAKANIERVFAKLRATEPSAGEPVDDFSDDERAFFSAGDELASNAVTVEELVDIADKELSFWQRFWKR